MNFKHIYERTKLMLINPAKGWQEVMDEYYTEKEIFRNYLIPITVIASIAVLASGFIDYKPFTAIGFGITNLVSGIAGTWLAYLVTREFLSGKYEDAANAAFKLTVYSAGIYIFFQGLGTAFGNGFLGQIFSLASIAFVYTLYKGINELSGFPAGQKTNAIIIAGLSIAFIPLIIKHLLMIVLGISVIII